MCVLMLACVPSGQDSPVQTEEPEERASRPLLPSEGTFEVRLETSAELDGATTERTEQASVRVSLDWESADARVVALNDPFGTVRFGWFRERGIVVRDGATEALIAPPTLRDEDIDERGCFTETLRREWEPLGGLLTTDREDTWTLCLDGRIAERRRSADFPSGARQARWRIP